LDESSITFFSTIFFYLVTTGGVLGEALIKVGIRPISSCEGERSIKTCRESFVEELY
jgi:hypothetical protein